MFSTLLVVVFGSAIFIFFSKEFGQFFKKIVAIPGVKLLLPLIVVTGLIVYFETLVLFALLYLKIALQNLVMLIEAILPFKTGAQSLVSIIILFGFTMLPIYALNYWSKRKTYEVFQHSLLLSIVIWLLLAIIFSVNLDY
jgi:hypothetical protein